MKPIIWFVCILFSSVLMAQEMSIGVLRSYNVKRILFSYNQGSYQIFGDSTDFGAILPNEFVDIRFLSPNKISMNKGAVHLGNFSKITLVANQDSNSITLTSKTPKVKIRKYQGNFELSPEDKGLRIVNLVDMNDYLSGVVESEGGGGRDIEYYKVQAIMCRTYALKSIGKHEEEGFQLCDRVHCQAYHSMLRFTPNIRKAVKATENLVLIDEDEHLAGTFFHANCGGQTSQAAYVWNRDLPYLSSFKDTFCIYTKQANWEKRVPQQTWADFLVKKYNYPIYDSLYGAKIFHFEQSERTAFYHSAELGIPLRDLRRQFKLKSTFFSCHPEGLEVVIKGRGVGHGVGLCQEGAMRMAKYGYNYLQIALFYFPGLKVVNYLDYLYFRQRESHPENF
ncbi:MAG: SpoIID/LytB domain-containing protein [Bacteroidetes bacterium]|nr:MAG: SpoIID/LytB domain-containing protein [Bacteroidota bacterium]